MEGTYAAILLNLGIGVAMLGLLFGRLWPQARRERLQQDLFTLRNELFIFVGKNHMSYEDEAYKDLRATLNATIRYAERFNVIALLVCSLKRTTPDPIKRAVDPKLEEKLQDIRKRFAIRFVNFLIFSPHAMPIVMCFLLVTAVRTGTQLTFRLIVSLFKSDRKPDGQFTDFIANLRPVRTFESQARQEMVHQECVGSSMLRQGSPALSRR